MPALPHTRIWTMSECSGLPVSRSDTFRFRFWLAAPTEPVTVSK